MSDTNGGEAQIPPAGTGPDKPKSWALKAAFWLFGIGAVALIGVALFAAFPRSETGGYARFATGALEKLVVDPNPAPMPATAFQTADGGQATLADFKGQVVVVNLWATWCAPCVTEMPTLGALQAAYGDQGLKVVAISVDRVADLPGAQKDLADLGKGHLTFFADSTYRIAYDLKAQGFPTTIVYDRSGREIARLAGGADWFSTEAQALVKEALAEPAPSKT